MYGPGYFKEKDGFPAAQGMYCGLAILATNLSFSSFPIISRNERRRNWCQRQSLHPIYPFQVLTYPTPHPVRIPLPSPLLILRTISISATRRLCRCSHDILQDGPLLAVGLLLRS